MTVAPDALPPSRATRAGLVLALALAAYTAWLFVLALIVWSQGLPKDYDTRATTSIEALTFSRGMLLGFLLVPSLFIASVICLNKGAGSSRATMLIRAVAAVALVFSVGFGLFNLRTSAGFGW